MSVTFAMRAPTTEEDGGLQTKDRYMNSGQIESYKMA